MAQLLSAVAPGTLVQLNENSSPVQFYVAKHDYESGLNGAGRTLLVRKDIKQNGAWNNPAVNAYAESDIDYWFNTPYKSVLDEWVQKEIGTTTFYYTPGNNDWSISTLSRAIFTLSVQELGLSNNYANSEGSTLPISSMLRTVYFNGSSVGQWNRTPYKNDVRNSFVSANGATSFYTCTSAFGYRPCFTLSGSLLVLDDGTFAAPPLSITTSALIMQGNSIPISWDGVSGADSYILQRKADSGEWEQVYAGSDATFTDTAGSWSTVQYQVCGVFSGINGVFAQSDVITVVPASTLVISGNDGNLGTITADIPYSVATDTGNQIALTRTVNGALVASLTVNSGFAYNIPVMDLPTGTGTIVITATVQTSSDPVTVTRTWTYTKEAQTFPTSGGLAQLTQDGQPIFPLTLAEAVKTIGGPWGANLGTALDKLAMAAVYNREQTPKYTEVTVDLSKVKAGDIVNLPENGVMVPFYVASLDYEPTLNTGGTRVLLVRKDAFDIGQWNASGVNAYADSTIDTWFNSTYLPMLGSTVQAQVGATTFQYTPGNGSNTVTTLARAVFALSLTELGLSNAGSNAEGESLPIASYLTIVYKDDGSQTTQFTRSPSKEDSATVFAVNQNGPAVSAGVIIRYAYRPCFTLPTTFQATYLVDSSGTVHPEQEYTQAGDFSDLWGNIIPTAKIETGSYVGTGTYGRDNLNTLTFGFEPKLVFIGTDSTFEDVVQGSFVFVRPAKTGGGYVAVTTQGGYAQGAFSVVLNWDGNSVSWYSTKNSYAQLNYQGLAKYYYIAIG